MPVALKKFYVPVVIVMGLFSVFAGYTLAGLQKSSGPGEWHTSETETISGLLRVDPYPVLHRIDLQDETKIESILLVNQGKLSAEAFSKPFHNQYVSVTGFPIRRGGWTMLELNSPDNVVANSDSISSDLIDQLKARVDPEALGPVSLAGEIIDSKCFLGVMKPGEGSVHKACAEVCLIGGIPSMLLVRGDDDLKYGYLLTQPDGSNAAKVLSSKAADKVEVSGELMQQGDLLYIKMAENGMRG